MKFNTAIKSEKSEAFKYFMILINRKSLIEVKKISPKRTLNQNSYLRLIIAYFGVHFGYTPPEAKVIYKLASPDLYVYEKLGRKFLRSSADLSVDEMAQSIDIFMQKSKEQGCPLPLATDQGWLREIDNEIERNKYH